MRSIQRTYEVTLAPDLKRLDGEKVDADFHETLNTPPMQLKGWNSTTNNYPGSNDATSVPRFSLLFNVDVDAAAAAPFIQFVGSEQRTVAAKVERADVAKHGDRYFPMWKAKDHSLKTWAERFYEKATMANGLEARGDNGAGANQLWVEPAEPLPPGDWGLVVAKDLPGKGSDLRLPEAEYINIGVVRPFEVKEVSASNNIGSARQLHIQFSKALDKDIKAENIARWIHVVPSPRNLEAQSQWREVVLTGDFELGKEYQVIVAQNLPAAEAFTLAGEYKDTVTFEKMAPRLYFEEFSTHQMSTGSRQFHLLAINVPKVRLSARLFPADAAPEALAAYENYLNPPRQERHPNYEEPFDKVDLSKLPSQMVWQRVWHATSAADEQKQIALDWNEILGAGKTGIVLLTAEQAGDKVGDDGRPGVQTLVQVTDLGIVWKESRGQTFAHVFSMSTGKAVAGAKVRVFDKDKDITDEETTDAEGVARVETGKDSEWLLVASGADTHLVDFRNRFEEISLRQLGIRDEYIYDDENGAADTRQALIFTERPVYKPGDTVHMKGIVRDWRESHPHVPAGAKATLRVTDARDRRILSRTLEISDVGSFAEDLKLPSSGMGTCHIDLVMAEDGADATAHRRARYRGAGLHAECF